MNTIGRKRKGDLYTFQKSDRILKRNEFLRIFKSGQGTQNRQFKVVFVKKNEGKSRIGITVTKRVGNATKRNRIKRLIREFFRNNRQILPSKVDINIIAKKEAVMLNNQEIFVSLNNIFEKIGEHVSRNA